MSMKPQNPLDPKPQPQGPETKGPLTLSSEILNEPCGALEGTASGVLSL